MTNDGIKFVIENVSLVNTLTNLTAKSTKGCILLLILINFTYIYTNCLIIFRPTVIPKFILVDGNLKFGSRVSHFESRINLLGVRRFPCFMFSHVYWFITKRTRGRSRFMSWKYNDIASTEIFLFILGHFLSHQKHK